jgi:DNA topoisomerase-1
MRTDSTRVSQEAIGAASRLITEQMGAEYARDSQVRPRGGKGPVQSQDAHEAIRPTDPSRRPEDVRQHLRPEQFRLYDLIWRRFIASRMAPASFDQTQAEIEGGPFVFRASGSVLVFDGFYRVWERDDRDEANLPELLQDEPLQLHGLEHEQHFTQPPPRYSEATLINELEKRGIGRPSTYASIVGTIQDHRYVEQKERRLHPTPLGEGVNRIMVEHFAEIVDDRYTAAMEERLDEVEKGQVQWVPVVSGFYHPLERMLSAAEEALPAETGEACPECGEGQLLLKASRYGPFKGCSRYPACRYRLAVTPNGDPDKPAVLEEACPECGKPLQVKRGRYGEFVGCSGFPECRYIRKDAARAGATPTGQVCPECKQGELLERSGRYGPWLGCSRFPECTYRVNKGKEGKRQEGPKLLDEPCPLCGKPLVERQGRFGTFKSCSDFPRCQGPKGAPKPTARKRTKAPA